MNNARIDIEGFVGKIIQVDWLGDTSTPFRLVPLACTPLGMTLARMVQRRRICIPNS